MSRSFQKGEQFGEYRLGEKLWQGTFSESWEAQSSSRGAVVVQHVQNPMLIEEMGRHDLQVHPMTNPSLAQLLAIDDSLPAFIWKYYKGRRLYKFIKELKKIKLHVAIYIARKILETLIFTTSRGRFHGGLRSTRVLITPGKRVIVTNFDVGAIEQRVLSQIAKDPHESLKFQHILPYFPQEVLEDHLYDDPKSDIFAVGVLMVEMIVGRALPAEKIPKALKKINLKEPIAAIIDKAVADFGDRYHHPREMYQELTHLLRTSDNVDTIYVPPPKPSRVSMEAIPADSEEYRVYQAEVLSAKQAIDAEVVAEPVDADPDFEYILGKREVETGKGLKEKVVLVPTIDKKILDRLEKEAVWPDIFLTYLRGASISLIFLALIAFFFSPGEDARPENMQLWPLLPLYAIGHAPALLEAFFTVSATLLFVFLFFLPLADPQGKWMQSRFARMAAIMWAMAALFLGSGEILSGAGRIMTYLAAVAMAIGWLFSLQNLREKARS